MTIQATWTYLGQPQAQNWLWQSAALPLLHCSWRPPLGAHCGEGWWSQGRRTRGGVLHSSPDSAALLWPHPGLEKMLLHEEWSWEELKHLKQTHIRHAKCSARWEAAHQQVLGHNSNSDADAFHIWGSALAMTVVVLVFNQFLKLPKHDNVTDTSWTNNEHIYLIMSNSNNCQQLQLSKI